MEKIGQRYVGGKIHGVFTVALYKPSGEQDAEFGALCRASGFDPGLTDEEIAGVTSALVTAKDGDGAVFGFAQFGGGNYCNEVFVEEKYRRQGVATAMYDLYEAMEGVLLRPHDLANEAASRYWSVRRRR